MQNGSNQQRRVNNMYSLWEQWAYLSLYEQGMEWNG
jgi:hypothetical protein